MTPGQASPGPLRRALVLVTGVYADGGIQRFNRTFLSACDRLNIECDVLSLADTAASRVRWTPPASATIRVFDGRKVRFALAACAALVRGGYDFALIGHANLLSLAAAAVSIRPRPRTRVMLIAHGIEVWNGLASGGRRRAMRAVDLVLSVSRYTRERIRKQVPELTEERFTVFPNALSETWTERFGSADVADVQMILPQRFFLSVTRLDQGDRYKGIVTVIESLAMLPDSSVHYIVAGRGDDREFLERIAARAGLAERVHFLGAVSDAQLVALYRRCMGFVLPSGNEGFGIVFLEAMYFGAPVIAAREKGTLDVVRDGETGLLVPYGDSVSLTSAMRRLLGDAALRERLRVGGRASVVGEGAFTFQAYVARLATIFDVPAPVAFTVSPASAGDSALELVASGSTTSA